MNFRLIPLETHTASLNMALDEACMEAVREGRAPPTIRLYRWRPSAVSIGNFQCLHDEVDVRACHVHNVEVVRRETGGGAVYHDSEGEVTYSIIASEKLFPKDITASYKEICQCIIDALEKLGLHAEFRPINDITVNGKKVSGNAQTRKNGVLLQHGTILYAVDALRMFSYLTPDKAKLSDKPYVKSVQAAVTSISDEAKVPRERFEAELTRTFSMAYHALPGSWTQQELERGRMLAATKYSAVAWNETR